MLLPLTKEMALLRARKTTSELCIEANDLLVDQRSQDVSFTVFDWIGKASATTTKMLVQTGREEICRVARTGVPLTLKPKEAVNVVL